MVKVIIVVPRERRRRYRRLEIGPAVEGKQCGGESLRFEQHSFGSRRCSRGWDEGRGWRVINVTVVAATAVVLRNDGEVDRASS